jgi:Putative addiction module component
MATAFESLEKEVMGLPQDQRVTLAHRILLSTEPVVDPAVDALWETEILRRIDLLDRGATERHPASDVFAELDLRLGR